MESILCLSDLSKFDSNLHDSVVLNPKTTEIIVLEKHSSRISGKFSDDSIESDWYWKTNLGNKEFFPSKVFYIPYNKNLTNIQGAFASTKIERVEELPNTSQLKNFHSLFAGCHNLKYVNLSNLDTSNILSLCCMFKGCDKLVSLDFSNFDTSKVIKMDSMFERCSSLESLDLSNFNTSNVDDMDCMFSNCSGLTSLNVSSFDTSKVTNMNRMFNECRSLKSLDVSSFNTSKVTNMSQMFALCTNLVSLDLSNFDISNVTEMYDMFTCCEKLETLNVSGWTLNRMHVGMFYQCNSLKKLIVGNVTQAQLDLWRARLKEASLLDKVTIDYKLV